MTTSLGRFFKLWALKTMSVWSKALLLSLEITSIQLVQPNTNFLGCYFSVSECWWRVGGLLKVNQALVFQYLGFPILEKILKKNMIYLQFIFREHKIVQQGKNEKPELNSILKQRFFEQFKVHWDTLKEIKLSTNIA